MLPAILITLAIPTDLTPEQTERLQTFREEFISITPGMAGYPKSFVMGRHDGGRDNERPAHEVTFDYHFKIAKFEVTQDLWQAIMQSNPSRWKGSRNSVEMISFEEAQQFCRRATELMRAARLIAQDEFVRLPTEAEWEYVARAGTTTVYSFGDGANRLEDYAWYTGNAAGNDPPVGAKNPNAWGLYDVHGYLWEWCLDTFHRDYRTAPSDGSAWRDSDRGGQRILRGGSWKDPPTRLTSSYRRAAPATLRDDAVGLRCVLAR